MSGQTLLTLTLVGLLLSELTRDADKSNPCRGTQTREELFEFAERPNAEDIMKMRPDARCVYGEGPFRMMGHPPAPFRVEGLVWAWYGQHPLKESHGCVCSNSRLDLDDFARVYVPQCYRGSRIDVVERDTFMCMRNGKALVVADVVVIRPMMDAHLLTL